MKAREEMPLLRCALGPTGRPFGDGLHSVTASGTDGRKAVITRNWDMAGSTLKKPIRGRKMGVGAQTVPPKCAVRDSVSGVRPNDKCNYRKCNYCEYDPNGTRRFRFGWFG